MKIHLPAIIFLFIAACPCRAQKPHLAVGDAIPAFTLAAQNGQQFRSAGYAGKKALVIYFYPKDESPGCTKEACSFRDSHADFEKAGAVIVGINSAPAETHKRFAAHHNLPFTLLSDPGNKVLHQFGVKGKVIITGRETFVEGRDGKVAYTYNSFTDGAAHATETLRFLQSAAQ